MNADRHDTPDRRPRGYSEGLEHMPSLPSSARVGRYSDGIARSLADAGAQARIGTYADGLALRPDAAAARRIGGYGDRFVPPVDPTPARTRLGVPRPRPQTA